MEQISRPYLSDCRFRGASMTIPNHQEQSISRVPGYVQTILTVLLMSDPLSLSIADEKQNV